MIIENLQPFSPTSPQTERILDSSTGHQGATTALTFEYSDLKLLPRACLTEAEGFAPVALALTQTCLPHPVPPKRELLKYPAADWMSSAPQCIVAG